MHVIVTETEKFQAALARVAATVSRSDNNPMLSAVKLWTKDDQLLITAVDTSSHQITLSVHANVQIPGEVLVDAEHFQKTISRIGKHPLTFKQDGSHPLIVNCGEDVREFYLSDGLVADFPMTATLPPQVGTLDGNTLHQFAKGLLYGTVQKDQRLSFTSHPDTMQLRGYSGDFSSGIVVRSIMNLLTKTDEFSFSIPFSVWRKIPQFTEPLTLHVGNDLVALALGDQHFVVRCAATEPNAQVNGMDLFFDLPRKGFFIVRTKQLREKLGALKVSKSTEHATMTIHADETRMVLSATDKLRGTATNQLGVQEPSGQTPSLLLKCGLMDKAILAVGSEEQMCCYMLYQTDDGDEDDLWILKLYDEQNPNVTQALIMSMDQPPPKE